MYNFFRTNSLLEKVCEGVGAAWFYTCIWQCVRSNSPVRLPAISYVLQHFNKKLSMEDQLYLMGNDIDVMVRNILSFFCDKTILDVGIIDVIFRYLGCALVYKIPVC